MSKKVGYKSPPMHSQWQPGQSGNPTGRKKGSKNFLTDLVEELAEVIQVTEGGKAKRITKQRALIKASVTKGIKGEIRAASLVFALAAKQLALKIEEAADADLSPMEQAALDALLDRKAAQRVTQTKEDEQ